MVGIGPGEFCQMTMAAKAALSESEVIAGYTVYVDLVKPYYPEKEYIVTAMKKERERCKLALETAMEGRVVSMVCSGDAGVYGMAGILLEYLPGYEGVELVVIPGITAALSGGAVLGAPLGHDFAVISLSDLLTPWEKIEARLRAAAKADFCICIYNPSSRKRSDYLERACKIMLEEIEETRVCGFVRNIGREGQSYRILSLKELETTQVDMFTTVFIGNSQTKQIGEYMVTPRGYKVE